MADLHFRYEDSRELLSSVKNLKINFNVVTLNYIAYSKCMFEQNTIGNFNVHLARGRSGRETKLLNS